MLKRKLFRTMKAYRGQFLSMIVMIALGVGVFLGFQMEWVSIEGNTGSFFRDTGFADYRLVSETGFSQADLDRIRDLAGVDAAARYLSVPADLKQRAGHSLALSVTTDPAVSGFLVLEGEPYDPESPDGVWISDKFADANDLHLGDALDLDYQNLTLSGTIRGLVKASEHLICVRDETQLMPDYERYGFCYVSPALYEKATSFEYYPQIHVRSDLSKQDFIDAANAALGKTLLVLSKNETISYAEAMGESEEGKTMGAVLPVLFLLIAVLTMVTTMHRLTVQEKTQIGTLKALGFRDRRILRHYSAYAFWIGVVGACLGVGIGYWLAWFIMNPNGSMGTYLDMPDWKLWMPWWCVAIILAMIGMLTLVGYLSVRKMLQGSAADALRPYVPKKMRHLLLERSRLWQKLSFGARWNLRDSLRHKTRTLMSLIGVMGCMLILVAGLGMVDTLDAFLDLYYSHSMNYSSRIFLSQEVGDEELDRLLEAYPGDWSASQSVELFDKTVSLDVYHLERDAIRFFDDKEREVPLGDDGAYLCQRISRDYDLHPGDSLSVKPYGTDQVYTLRVAGVIRSVSESIVLSDRYAEALGVDLRPDSLYTELAREDITQDSAIRAVQAKSDIMDSFDTFIELMNTMIVLLVLAAAILGVVVLYNLGSMSYLERYREMATLKVVGFRDRQIARLLIGQNLWITLIGALLGLPLGVAVLDYLLKKLAGEYEMGLHFRLSSALISMALTFGVSLIVGLMIARKNRKIDMVAALKGAE